MKKVLVLSAMMLTAVVSMAKDIKTVVVTTQPQKGVKQIECNIDEQRVTITYDADKTNSNAIIQSFGKFGYKATEIKAEKPAEKNKK